MNSLTLLSKQMNLTILASLVRGDEELDTLLYKVCIPGGGVIPHIHKALLVRKDVEALPSVAAVTAPGPREPFMEFIHCE